MTLKVNKDSKKLKNQIEAVQNYVTKVEKHHFNKIHDRENKVENDEI